MLLLLAGFTAFAVMASNQIDQTLSPDANCLAVAQAVASDLQPFADKLAGKPVNIKVVPGTPRLLMRLIEERGSMVVVAEINSERELVIFPTFCAAPPSFKTALIAHEIGHLIDFSINTSPIFWRAWSSALVPWKLRPIEKVANEYGRELIKLKGGDIKIIDLLG
jgi:hypothetical protein